ncbi:MAG: hypothetical protein QOF33_2811 [Thermomicrobiales bacterium]|jgi:hypothetical protein|nr:hypothetical protein [Thermomicrobiales bacterium]
MMRPRRIVPVSRRLVLGRLAAAAGGLAAGVGLGRGGAVAQDERLTASGTGVNLKLMLDRDGEPTVPLRELFGFDPYYAQCVIEDNPTTFAMDTFAMGRVVVEPHTFFMAMYAHDISLVGIHDAGGGKRLARLTGDLGCLTEVGTASGRVGSRETEEPAFFEIEAIDGGHGGGAAGDRFSFIVYFDPKQAPVNHGIFGPNPTFTGELVAGEVTIGLAASLPLVGPVGTPAP